jgi:hypothetical protein
MGIRLVKRVLHVLYVRHIQKILIGNPERRQLLESQFVKCSIILNLVLKLEVS